MNSLKACLPHTQDHNDWMEEKMHLISTCHRSELELRWHLDDYTNRFQLLKKVMSGSLQNIVRKIVACATLHNFIIAKDGVQDMEEVEEQSSGENKTTTPFGLNYHPTIPDGDVFTSVADVSHTRDAMLEIICELNMQCPHNNLM